MARLAPKNLAMAGNKLGTNSKGEVDDCPCSPLEPCIAALIQPADYTLASDTLLGTALVLTFELWNE